MSFADQMSAKAFEVMMPQLVKALGIDPLLVISKAEEVRLILKETFDRLDAIEKNTQETNLRVREIHRTTRQLQQHMDSKGTMFARLADDSLLLDGQVVNDIGEVTQGGLAAPSAMNPEGAAALFKNLEGIDGG